MRKKNMEICNKEEEQDLCLVLNGLIIKNLTQSRALKTNELDFLVDTFSPNTRNQEVPEVSQNKI